MIKIVSIALDNIQRHRKIVKEEQRTTTGRIRLKLRKNVQ